MSLFNIFNISGSALGAQSVRLNTVASNLANAEVASSTPEGAYKARHPVFSAVLQQIGGAASGAGMPGAGLPEGVRVAGIYESQRAPRVEHMPGHPLANAEGNVYFPAVNTIEEMADMMSASRSYQNNVEVLSTVKQLMLHTLQLGRR